jgi:NitT/TauT family transport system substrate-binding protein
VKKLIFFLLAGLLIFDPFVAGYPEKNTPFGMAVEFNIHAACAYISQDKGWFEQEGLEPTAYKSYVTGMALASALARGDIQVAYICLVPAINTYANARVPIRIVAGTHKYGYGLVVEPHRIKTIGDLTRPGIRIGCVREGGACDVLLRKTIDKYHLDEGKILNNIQRMNPPRQVLAIKMGQLDAAFLPEQWATMAEEYGFHMLLMSQDVWPEMQGSVLVVKDDLLNSHPEVVRKLVKVSQKAIDWANQHPYEAAEVMARQLGAVGEGISPAWGPDMAAKLKITPELMLRSMARLEYCTAIDPRAIQQTIDYLAEIGYLKRSPSADDMVDLRFLEDE